MSALAGRSLPAHRARLLRGARHARGRSVGEPGRASAGGPGDLRRPARHRRRGGAGDDRPTAVAAHPLGACGRRHPRPPLRRDGGRRPPRPAALARSLGRARAQHQRQPERCRRRPGSLCRRRPLDPAGDPAGRAAARGPRRIRRLLADPPPSGRADRGAGAARRALSGRRRLGDAIPAAGRRRSPPRARLRLAVAAEHLHGAPLGAPPSPSWPRRWSHCRPPPRSTPGAACSTIATGGCSARTPRASAGTRPTARSTGRRRELSSCRSRASTRTTGRRPTSTPSTAPTGSAPRSRGASPPWASRSSSTPRPYHPGPTLSTSTGSTSWTAG